MSMSDVGPVLLAILPTLIVAITVIVGLYLNAKWSKSTNTADAKKRDILGYAILAVKTAEKIIPDTTKAAWLQKADASLKIFCETYTKYEGQAPTEATKVLFIKLKEEVLLEIEKIKAEKLAAEAAAAAKATTPVAPVVVPPAV